jgi:hypothetical protein
MSRWDLAEAVAAWLFEQAGHVANIGAEYVGKLERGEHRWPSAHYRTAFRAVLGAESDAQLGFFVIRGGNDAPGAEADPVKHEVGMPVAAPAVKVSGGLAEERAAVDGSVFGVRLRRLRVGRGFSLRRLGSLVHYSYGYLWQLETGAKRPTVEVASALDRALGSAGALSALVAADAVAVGDEARGVPASADVRAGGLAVRVSAAPGAQVTVVCDEGGSGRVAVVAGGVRVLIDASDGDPASPGRAVVDASVVVPVGGAKVYSLAARRRAAQTR